MDENEMILQEIRDHAKYWHSDMAKRLTVEKHLTQKGINDVSAKIDKLIEAGRLTRIPKRGGDYLKENGSRITRIDPNERCSECGAMGDHSKRCSKYPASWRNCDGHEAGSDGICIKCGCPVF